MKEEAIIFGANSSLVGVLTQPAAQSSPAADTGLILLNAGILHRVGPGRIYVKIARQLTLLGVTSFRFDFSGIGDSKPRQDNLPFDKSSIDESRAAMNFVQTKCGIDRFILMGGCSGARVSLDTSTCDARIVACILINFQVTPDDERDAGSDADRRKDEHYYLKFAARDPGSWRKLLTGRADYAKLFGALTSALRRRFTPAKYTVEPPRWAAFRDELKRVVERGVKPIFVCSDGDPSLDEIREAGGRELAQLRSENKAEIVVIPRSDHTFSSLADQESLIKALEEHVSDIVRSAVPVGSEPRTFKPYLERPAGDKIAHVQ